MSLKFDFAEAAKFLDFISEGEETHTFQFFDDTKAVKGFTAAHFVSEFDDACKAKLGRMNAMLRGVYFMVNQGDGSGRSTENVTRVRALFVDLDGAPLEPLLNSPLEPHIIVQSGPATYHGYWMVEDCPLDEFSKWQERLAAVFNGDPGVKDLPRVMRIPGFFNCKPKYGDLFKVKVLQWNESLPYKLENIVSQLGLDSVEIAAQAKKGKVSIHLDEIPPEGVTEGNRHNWLKDVAYNMALSCETPQNILAKVTGLNLLYCKPPKEMDEVKALVQWAVDNVPSVDVSDIYAMRPVVAELLASADEVSEDGDSSEDDEDLGLALPEELLLSAPGLVGEITAFIAESNFYWQPAYALASALAFVGMLKGHQVRSEENARTNLLTIAVGPSSSGKSQPNKRLYALAVAAGIKKRLSGEPASETALYKSIAECGNKTFLTWDEIGLSFKQMFSPRAAQYKAGIVRSILKIFSCADSVCFGNQYANVDGKTPRFDLIEPCLCMYGTSTIDGIYSAMSSTEAINGFTARLLIFETGNYVAESQPVGNGEIPQDLIDRVKRIANEPDPTVDGNLASLDIPAARIVPLSPSARSIMYAARKEFNALKNKAIIEKKAAEEAIWGRAYEHAIKIALTVEDSPTITDESATWAVKVVTALCKKMIVACRDRIADNQTHAELNSILRIIKEAYPKWIETKLIYKKTRAIMRLKRKEYLLSLQEEGSIEMKEETTGGRKRQLYRYKKKR